MTGITRADLVAVAERHAEVAAAWWREFAEAAGLPADRTAEIESDFLSLA